MAETLCADCTDNEEVVGAGAHCDNCNQCLDCNEVHTEEETEERDWYAESLWRE